MKFRKLPIEVEAFQLTEHYTNWPAWAHDALNYDIFITHNMGKFRDDSETYLEIDTLEGTMKAKVNDWIVKGIKGEFWPVKPDIFKLTYEKIDE